MTQGSGQMAARGRGRGRGRAGSVMRLAGLAAVSAALVLLAGGCNKGARRASTAVNATERNREEAQRAYEAGYLAQQASDLDRAVAEYRRAVELEPSLGGAWNNLGAALALRGDYMAAANSLHRAVELLPSDPSPLENLGYVYLEAGFAERALDYYVQSLGRDPNWLPSLRGAADAGKQLRLSDKLALERLERGLMIETDPKWRELFYSERDRVRNDLRERRWRETQ